MQVFYFLILGVMGSLSSDKSSQLHNKTEAMVYSYIAGLEVLHPCTP